MTKHIAIIGSALSGNKGAAAMLESAIQTLGKDESVDFTLFSMYPMPDGQQNNYAKLSIVDASPLKLGVGINTLALLYRILPPVRKMIRNRSAAINQLVAADVLLDQGGITFVDGREKFLIYNIASILPALMVGTPVVKCAQALGPFKNSINRSAAKIFLPRMAAIISRGAITHEYLKGLNLKNITAGADYAFSLELTEEEEKAAQSKFKPKLGEKKVVGVSPSVVMQKKVNAKGGNYEKEITSFINYLTKNGYGVLLVPHSVRSNTEKTHNNDMPLCKSIFASTSDKEAVMFLDQELSSQELRYWIGQTNYFIASRFHAMVSSLAMQVPTLVIGWSHKYREVLDMFGLEEWAFGQDKLNQNYLRKRFEDLVNNETEIKTKLKKSLPAVKQLSYRQVEVIQAIINN
jgi:colanic acid/amylovoran biosynthesis protein